MAGRQPDRKGRIRAAVPTGRTAGDTTGAGRYGTDNDIAARWPPRRLVNRAGRHEHPHHPGRTTQRRAYRPGRQDRAGRAVTPLLKLLSRDDVGKLILAVP